jgi:hypothetical protein
MPYDITTYTGLSEAIQAYTEVDETSFVANIPNFVANTERLVNNTVQLPAFKAKATLATIAEDPYVALPSGFLSVFSLALVDENNRHTFLLNKDINYIRECFPYPDALGPPTTYALYGVTRPAPPPAVGTAQIMVGPTPDYVYALELQYFSYPTSIVTAGSTWLSVNYPNVLLWGALAEAYIYLKGEDNLIQTYQAKYGEALTLLKQLGDGKDREDSYRTVQVRQQVQ